MKGHIITTLLSLLFACHGDVLVSRNHRLPLNAVATIPTPVLSLLPPTFENPIRDYTVGLVPPPADSQLLKTVQAPVNQEPTRYTTGHVSSPGISRAKVQQRIGSARGAVHHSITHHSTNLVQPQVNQPKTVIHQHYQQPNTHHHHHQQQHQPNSRGTGLITPPVSQPYSFHSVSSTPQYYAPVIQSAAHQHSSSVHYAAIPLHGAPTVVERVRPSVQQPAIVSRPVSPSGVRIIHTYPSVSYATPGPQHGSTLNLGNAKLDPELAYIISDVLRQYQF